MVGINPESWTRAGCGEGRVSIASAHLLLASSFRFVRPRYQRKLFRGSIERCVRTPRSPQNASSECRCVTFTPSGLLKVRCRDAVSSCRSSNFHLLVHRGFPSNIAMECPSLCSQNLRCLCCPAWCGTNVVREEEGKPTIKQQFQHLFRKSDEEVRPFSEAGDASDTTR